MSDGKQYQTVYLEPFIHQVGGHSQMFSLDRCTVCKPLISRELHFYQSMPCQMKPFAPEFRGVVKAKVVEESDGFVAVVALVPKSYLTLTGQQITDHSIDSTRRHVRLHRSGRIEMMEGQRSTAVFEKADGAEELESSCRDRLVPYNPWLLHCTAPPRDKDNAVSTDTAKLKSSLPVSLATSSPPQHLSLLGVPTEYLLLENLTCSYKRPCVLDLKMGTRQYADDDTDAKQKRKKAKAASSTSASLGVRINGMQVYDPSLNRYLCRSKYYGRQLTVQGFKESLRLFLSGVPCRSRRLLVVQQLLHRLAELHEALQQLSTFRFFTSSLLLLYDAFADEETHQCGCCLHTTTEGGDGGDGAFVEFQVIERGSVPDSISASNNKNRSKSPLLSRCRSSSLHRFNSVGADTNTDTNSKCETNNNNNNKSARAGVLVDVRVIDFAHATHELLDTETAVRHVGPDSGFIFGVRTLLQELQLVLGELTSSCSQ